MSANLMLLGLLALGQSPTAASTDAAQLERIRKALDSQPAMTTEAGTDEAGRPIFRMNVRAPKAIEPVWDNWTNVPSYIRPWLRGYHHEFMEMVTPEEFRAGTLYPVGIPVVTLLELLDTRIATSHRKSQEARAREEVRQALAELVACRADPMRPGC
jgi:hypothetical protein